MLFFVFSNQFSKPLIIRTMVNNWASVILNCATIFQYYFFTVFLVK